MKSVLGIIFIGMFLFFPNIYIMPLYSDHQAIHFVETQTTKWKHVSYELDTIILVSMKPIFRNTTDNNALPHIWTTQEN